MSKDKKLRIRNSTAEFLIFTRQAGDTGIEVRVAEETVWLTQKLMAALFEVTVPTINEHLANLLEQGEIAAAATIRNFRTVQREGNRNVSRNVDFYNLDAIIAVGFRVNSARFPERQRRGSYQPRATPWVTAHNIHQGPTARPIRTHETGLWPLISFYGTVLGRCPRLVWRRAFGPFATPAATHHP